MLPLKPMVPRRIRGAAKRVERAIRAGDWEMASRATAWIIWMLAAEFQDFGRVQR